MSWAGSSGVAEGGGVRAAPVGTGGSVPGGKMPAEGAMAPISDGARAEGEGAGSLVPECRGARPTTDGKLSLW